MNNSPVFIDCETAGLVGVPVLIQYAIGDGEIILFSPWTEPISKSLKLIESFLNHKDGCVFFNAVFDIFHLIKLYNIFRLYPDKNAIPERIIDDLAEIEMEARNGPCLKFTGICDLFLHARKTSYQSTMERSDIRVKKVPTALAWQLAAELEKCVPLKDIYFARRKNKHAPRWQVYDLHDSEGTMNPDFKDIVLKFAPSSGLKALAVDALNVKEDTLLLFGDVEVHEKFMPEEVLYAPFAKSLGGDRTNWRGAWPEKIQFHISHWLSNDLARKYAADDIRYTRDLYKFFGCPAMNEDDSVLTNCVAACRWRGYKVDIERLKDLKQKELKKIGKIPTAPAQVRWYVSQDLDETEELALNGSTKKTVLEDIAKLETVCPDCNKGMNPDLFDAPEQMLTSKGSDQCDKCKGKGLIKHSAAYRAQEVLDARAATKRIEIYDKLILAGRFHASFKVIGALSGRMSGSDGINPQGINKNKETRKCFPLASDGFELQAGDFESFEITLAVACYDDESLRKDLLTCEECEGEMIRIEEKNDFICVKCGGNKGKRIHALFGMNVYPGMSYEEIKNTNGTDNDKYTRCKSAVFALLYGGEGPTLQDRLGVNLEDANKAYDLFVKKYKKVGIERQKVKNAFESMRQPNGIGTRVEWNDPADYVESMLGFRRYFTLENMICKILFELANKPPKSWKDIKVKVVRRDREQTGMGATQSALYAAAFALQASNTRAAMNHTIQSTGAQITKKVQVEVWNLQPNGIHEFQVMPMNCHDELQCPTTLGEKVKETVLKTVETFRPKIPLIKMDWQRNLKTWADK